MSLPLQRATQLALKIYGELKPLCTQLVIAGSIRRSRPVCGDIDLVIEATEIQRLNIVSRCCERWVQKVDGPQNCIFTRTVAGGDEIQLDIFFARPESKTLFETTPSNFGTLLICRTGSKNHNIKLVEHAKRNGLRWNPYQGVYDQDNRLLASATEEEVFQALGLGFIPPQNREA